MAPHNDTQDLKPQLSIQTIKHKRILFTSSLRLYHNFHSEMLQLLSSIGQGKRYFPFLAVFVFCIFGIECSEGRCLTVASSDACYYIHEGSDTWWEAAFKCNGKEGHLVEFHTDREFIQVKKKAGERHDGIYYIGLMKLGPSPWFWYTTGKTMPVSRGLLNDEDYDNTAKCMALDFRYKPEGTLKQVSCDEKIGYICESPEKAILVHSRSSLLFEE